MIPALRKALDTTMRNQGMSC